MTETAKTEADTDNTAITEADSETTERTYTQSELDKIIKDKALRERRKYDRKLDGVDLDRARQLLAEEENREVEVQKQRGEFDKILKNTVEKSQTQIDQLTTQLQSVQIDQAIVSAASKMNAIAPDEVMALTRSSARLSADGVVEIVDESGTVRYSDSGDPMTVNDLVGEFLANRPHQVRAGSSGSGSTGAVGGEVKQIDLKSLDMKDPKDREIYKTYREQRRMNNG